MKTLVSFSKHARILYPKDMQIVKPHNGTCLCWNYGSLLEWWLYYWNDGYTIEKVARYWNGGYTIGMVAILLKRWLTIGMVAILLEWWLYY